MTLSHFNSSGTRLATLGADGQLSVWSHVQGNPVKLTSKVWSLSLQSFIIGRHCKSNFQFSTSSHLSAAPSCLQWASNTYDTNDRDLIALGTEAGNVYVYSSSLNRLMINKTVSGKVLSLCWGPDNQLYVGCDTGSVHVISVAGDHSDQVSEHVISHPGLTNPVHSLAVCNNVLAMASRNIVLWDLNSNTITRTLSGHSNPVSDLYFDPSGSYLFSR